MFRVSIFSNRVAETLRADGPEVTRPWENNADTTDQLCRAIAARRCRVVLIQYHFGFYPVAVLGSLIDRLTNRGIKVFVIYHCTQHDSENLSRIAPAMARAALNIVHNQTDLDLFSSLRLTNVRKIPLGVYQPTAGRRKTQPPSSRPMFAIGSFGFLMPHKGVIELLGAAHLVRQHVPDIRIKLYHALYPSKDSAQYLTHCEAYVDYLGIRREVEFVTSFLELNEVISRLSDCDLVAFPYQRSSESASASVRMGIASGSPTLCTPLPIFDEFRGLVHFSHGCDAFGLADSILEAYRDPGILEGVRKSQQQFLAIHSWPRIAEVLTKEIRSQAATP